jgi:ribulose kinase
MSFRSPYADPKAKGVVSGMTLDSTEVGLALVYLAAIQSIAYGTKQIVERLGDNGVKVRGFLDS